MGNISSTRPAGEQAPSVTIKGHGSGMADQDWTPGDVASMVANPFYAISIAAAR
jgi:hypothetical protein